MTTSHPSSSRPLERGTPFSRRREPTRAPFPHRREAGDRLRRLAERARAELAGNRLERPHRGPGPE
jgi:hypothetical protein